MAVSTGSTLLASDMTALFTRLEAVRKKHAGRSDLVKALPGAITSPVSQGSKVLASNVSAAKTNLTNIENSLNNMSGFASQITIPSVGDLVKASTITKVQSVLTNVESICANNTVNGFNSHNSVNGFNSHDGNDGNNSFDGFSCGHSFGNFTSNCSWF